MSSAISTDDRSAKIAGPDSTGKAAAGAPESNRGAFRPWHFFIVGALVAATAAVLVSSRTSPEHLVMLSVTVFAAGAAAYACYRMLLPLVGHSPQARAGLLGAIARRTLEREKVIVLRAIKELEFDRAMGKVADEDFAEISSRLRQRAMRLMRQLDDVETAARARVEQELRARVQGAPAPAVTAESRPACPSCETINDADARFCKACGAPLAA
jgi:hypothetical protein